MILPEPSPSAPRSPRFVAGAALALTAQSTGPGADVELRGLWMATRRIGVGARVDLPIADPTLSAPEGSASVAAFLFGAEVSAVLFDSAFFRLGADAGVAAAWLRTTGAPAPSYEGHASSTVTALPSVGVRLAPRLTDHVRLCFGAEAGIAAPKPEISFAGRNAGSWGFPLGIFSGGASVDF